jgi:hypothetical protein
LNTSVTPLELEPIEKLDEEAYLATQRQIGIRMHRPAMSANRQCWPDAAKVARQLAHDPIPDRATHQQSVQKNDDRSLSRPIFVADRSRG